MRRETAIDGLCVVLLGVASYAFLVPGIRPSTRQVTMPAIAVALDDSGALSGHFDGKALAAVCRKAGLPELPDLQGLDPVPLRGLFATIERWAGQRDGAAVGEMGEIALALRLDLTALRLLTAAAELDRSGSAKWLYLAGACAQTLGRDALAVALLTRSAKTDPDYPVTLARLATLTLEAGDTDRAEALFEVYQKRRPDSLGPTGLGQVALTRGDAAGALDHFDAALRARSNDFRAARLRARALALLGRVDESRAAAALADTLPEYTGWLSFDERLRDAHRQANTQVYLRNELGRASASGDWPRAASLAEELRARRPGDGAISATLAGVLYRAGRVEEALSAAAAAARLAPRSAAAQQVLAEIALNQGQSQVASRAAKAMAELDPDSPRAHELLGRGLFLAGDRARGLVEVDRAIELAPTSSELRDLAREMRRLDASARDPTQK